MARINLEHPVREIHGAFTRNGIINRRKTYRDSNGRIIHEGSQEAYTVRHPRDFKRNPPTGDELAHHNRWREACHRAAQILQSAQPDGLTDQQRFHRQINAIPDYYTLVEAQTLFADYRRRFEAQLPNTRGTHPDPDAPIDPLTGTGKRYAQFPTFLRAMLYHSLKSQP